MGVAIFTLQWLCFTFAPLNGSLKPTMNGAIFFFPATMGVGGTRPRRENTGITVL